MSDVLPMTDAASWQIAAEVCRRSPDLVIRLLHPGGGMYDCLALVHPSLGQVAHMNRVGRLHVWARLDGRPVASGPTNIWLQFLKRDPRSVVDVVSRRIGQSVPERVAATIPRVLVYRVIATVVGMHAFASHVWTCRSAAHDSSGMEGSFVSHALVSNFPGAAAELRRGDEDARLHRACEFWVLLRDGSPVGCLSEDGRALTRDGRTLDLPNLYLRKRRLAPVVWGLIRDYLD